GAFPVFFCSPRIRFKEMEVKRTIRKTAEMPSRHDCVISFSRAYLCVIKLIANSKIIRHGMKALEELVDRLARSDFGKDWFFSKAADEFVGRAIIFPAGVRFRYRAPSVCHPIGMPFNGRNQLIGITALRPT